jgi:hypothetical protein
MTGVIGDFKEEGSTGVLLDEAHRVLRDQDHHVSRLGHGTIVLEQIGASRAVGMLVVVGVPALEAEEIVVAVGVRTELALVAQMPFAQ